MRPLFNFFEIARGRNYFDNRRLIAGQFIPSPPFLILCLLADIPAVSAARLRAADKEWGDGLIGG